MQSKVDKKICTSVLLLVNATSQDKHILFSRLLTRNQTYRRRILVCRVFAPRHFKVAR